MSFSTGQGCNFTFFVSEELLSRMKCPQSTIDVSLAHHKTNAIEKMNRALRTKLRFFVFTLEQVVSHFRELFSDKVFLNIFFIIFKYPFPGSLCISNGTWSNCECNKLEAGGKCDYRWSQEALRSCCTHWNQTIGSWKYGYVYDYDRWDTVTVSYTIIKCKHLN